LADLAALSADYFSIPEEDVKHLESVLNVVGGQPVYAAEEFSKLLRHCRRCCRNGRRLRLTVVTQDQSP
jgi:hypothetical protein